MLHLTIQRGTRLMEHEVYHSAAQWWKYAIAPTVFACIGVIFWLGMWKGKVDQFV